MKYVELIIKCRTTVSTSTVLQGGYTKMYYYSFTSNSGIKDIILLYIYSFSKFHTSVSFICQKSASKRLSAFKHLIGTGTSKRLSGQRSDAAPSSSGFPDASSCLSSWKGNEVWFNSLTKFKTQLLIYYIK